MMLALFASLAFADSVTLDTGATIEGDLARYEYGGDCQLSVTEGELSGVILIVPCHRVQSFVRTTVRTPVPIGLGEGAVEVAVALDEELVARDEVAVALDEELVAAEPAGGPLAEPFYDEPLFPANPTEPIMPASASASATATRTEPTAAPTAPPAAQANGSAPGQADGVAPGASTLPTVPRPAAVETTGPRLAPRMDEPSPEHRPVSF